MSIQYSEIPLQANHPQAVADWVEQVYGIDVLHQLPVVAHEVWKFILSGYTEAMTLETIQAMFGVAPLKEGASL